MKLTWIGTAVLLVAMLIATGCSGDSDGSDDPTATSTSEASTGSGDTDGAGTQVDLGDFSAKLPDWADAVVQTDSGPLAIVQFIVPLEQRDATVAFYEAWTAGQTETYLRTDSESGGVTFHSDVQVGEDKTTVAILSPLDGDDFVAVTISRGVFE